ncbi:MAG: hypothetical protein ACR2F6_08875 [Mycobacteriales bacterium]
MVIAQPGGGHPLAAVEQQVDSDGAGAETGRLGRGGTPGTRGRVVLRVEEADQPVAGGDSVLVRRDHGAVLARRRRAEAEAVRAWAGESGPGSRSGRVRRPVSGCDLERRGHVAKLPVVAARPSA